MVLIGIVFVIGVVTTVRSDNTDRNDNKSKTFNEYNYIKEKGSRSMITRLWLVYVVERHFRQYFSYIVATTTVLHEVV
jgi:hypothetical protein